jgi:hypothetical protein
MSGEPIQLPIACSLDAGELSVQERRWAELIRAAGTGRVATLDGVELRFRHDAGVAAELEALVATERGCCAWARWEIARPDCDDDGCLVMRASAAGDGAAVLQSMFLRDA